MSTSYADILEQQGFITNAQLRGEIQRVDEPTATRPRKHKNRTRTRRECCADEFLPSAPPYPTESDMPIMGYPVPPTTIGNHHGRPEGYPPPEPPPPGYPLPPYGIPPPLPGFTHPPIIPYGLPTSSSFQTDHPTSQHTVHHHQEEKEKEKDVADEIIDALRISGKIARALFPCMAPKTK